MQKHLISLMGLALCVQAVAFAQPAVQQQLQKQFITANNGDTIRIAAGTFTLDGTLWLDDKKDIVIQGAGMDKTILSFAGQQSGAEGIKVTNATNITLMDLAVFDTKGDAIKVQATEKVTFLRVKTAWSGKPKETNGAYGLYPVNCDGVLIDGCEAVGASDAGIYVGQSKNIVVRNSRAWHNVAGIEIENSLYAEVYDNEAFNNTGGLLIFDLPDLVQKQGGYVRAYRNHVHDNNLANFAPKGNIVGKVPDGTGLLILATNHVEVFENKFINNNTVGTGIISYYMTENPIKDTLYYPYPDEIYIHNNVYQRANVPPSAKSRFGKLFRFKLKFGKDIPHILYDGIEDTKRGRKARICIKNNENQSYVNIDAEHGFQTIVRDDKACDCEVAKWK